MSESSRLISFSSKNPRRGFKTIFSIKEDDNILNICRVKWIHSDHSVRNETYRYQTYQKEAKKKRRNRTTKTTVGIFLENRICVVSTVPRVLEFINLIKRSFQHCQSASRLSSRYFTRRNIAFATLVRNVVYLFVPKI